MGRIKTSFSDDLGQWTGVELLGRDGRSLVIICAYQVCQKSGKTGTYTAYSQQVSLLRQRGHQNPNPRRHFVADHFTLIHQYNTTQFDIILMGDFNKVIGLDLNGMAKVIQKSHLTASKPTATALIVKNPLIPADPIGSTTSLLWNASYCTSTDRDVNLSTPVFSVIIEAYSLTLHTLAFLTALLTSWLHQAVDTSDTIAPNTSSNTSNTCQSTFKTIHLLTALFNFNRHKTILLQNPSTAISRSVY
jgi:hypothetical protein